ncbi:MAG TPA: ROK family protein [Bacteroidales bacterium]|nr:ROK family protein [Bacteroidales bacterium]
MRLEEKSNGLSLIGIDLGGTNIRAGKVSNGQIEKVASCLVPKTNNPDLVCAALIETIKQVNDPGVAGIGIGVPGLVENKTGLLYGLPNIPAFQDFNLGEALNKAMNLPVYVNNDANCFAVGECFFGDGRNFDDFVGLITGTGLGAGIIYNRHLVSGQNCGAGEFGVLPYKDQNLEFYASGQFFLKEYGRDASQMAMEARNGNPEAIAAFREYGKNLGVVIKAIVACIDPSAIIIGGGLSRSFSLYKESMWEEVQNFDFSRSIKKITIIPTTMPEIAIRGAAALYLNAVT